MAGRAELNPPLAEGRPLKKRLKDSMAAETTDGTEGITAIFRRKVLLKRLVNKKMAAMDSATEITEGDIDASSVVLFSVFGRYGDSVIAFKVIGEFTALNPSKKCILVTTHQLAPYARRLLPKLEVHSINIWKNPLKLLRLARRLKGAKIDLGFNPWSHGEDSEYPLTFAKRCLPYKVFSTHSKEYNLYARIREYLFIRPKGAIKPAPASIEGIASGSKVNNILIAPFSKDLTKSLSGADLDLLVKEVEGRFPGCSIKVALDKGDQGKLKTEVDTFFFGKKRKKSEEFLRLVDWADLFIGVDAGPLHLADALGVSSIGIFGPTAPETVLDLGSRVLAFRDPSLSGHFCFVKNCSRPVCIHRLFTGKALRDEDSEPVDFNRKVVLEEDECVLDDHVLEVSAGRLQKSGER